jgi:beta-galactosidase
MGHVIAAQFKQALYYADPSRPVTGNIVQRPYLGGRLIDEFGMAMDVTAFSHENENVPAYRALNTWKSVGLGESGSCESDRGEYAGNKTAGHMGFNAGVIACFARDQETLALPYNFGAYSWTLNDYLGETSWPATISHYGIFDNAGFAKDAAGYFTAAWAQPPDCTTIALGNSDWTAPVAPGAPVDVVAYTCAPAAELFLNGASLGVQQSAGSGAATWPRVAFAAGNLTALARDGAGAPLGAATLLSVGAPARLRLWVEDAYRAPRNGSVIAADGADVALLGVAVEDAAGRRVPVGAVNVTFSIAGPAAIYGVGNGDPADHAPVKFAASRRTFHGLARVIVQSTGAPGGIVVTATAPGVLQATAALVAE